MNAIGGLLVIVVCIYIIGILCGLLEWSQINPSIKRFITFRQYLLNLTIWPYLVYKAYKDYKEGKRKM